MDTKSPEKDKMSRLRRVLFERSDSLLAFIRSKMGARSRRSIASPEDVFQTVAVNILSQSPPREDLSNEALYLWIRTMADWTISMMVRNHRSLKRGGALNRVAGLQSGSYYHLWSRIACDRVTDPLSREAISEAMQKAIDDLPPRYRQILCLFELHSWPVADVAALLGETDRAVDSVLSRARARVRESLLKNNSLTSRCESLERRRGKKQPATH